MSALITAAAAVLASASLLISGGSAQMDGPDQAVSIPVYASVVRPPAEYWAELSTGVLHVAGCPACRSDPGDVLVWTRSPDELTGVTPCPRCDP